MSDSDIVGTDGRAFPFSTAISSDEYLCSIQMVYRGVSPFLDRLGYRYGKFEGSGPYSLLMDDDPIVRVEMRGGRYVDYVKFHTKGGLSLEGGGGGGEYVDCTHPGYRLGCIAAKDGDIIDRLELHWVPL